MYQDRIKRARVRDEVGCSYNQDMFARKLRVEFEKAGERQPCPMKWMDNFSMRNFTNASAFDDTLPVADGLMEIGAKVPTAALHDAMEDWFRRKSYLPQDALLVLTEVVPAPIVEEKP